MAKADETTLRAWWSKRERDVMFSGPRRCDQRLAYSAMACERRRGVYRLAEGESEWMPSFLDELEKRGYDLTTLRFSIKRKVDPATNAPDPHPHG